MPAGRLHFLGHAMTDGKGAVKIVLGLLPAKIGKDRALGEFLDIGAAFQPQPQKVTEKVGKGCGLHLIKKRLQDLHVIIFSNNANDGIKVEVWFVRVRDKRKKIRIVSVVPGYVPDDVEGPFPPVVISFLCHDGPS